MEIFQRALFKLLNDIHKIRKHWESMTDEEPQNTVSTEDVEEEKTTFQSLVIITFLYLNSINMYIVITNTGMKFYQIEHNIHSSVYL